jgi:hypothetical protein
MKRKPIKIDWDELEEAFSTPARAAAHYFDRISGHVVLEGEEDDDYDEDRAAADNPMAVATARSAVAREDPTKISIVPPNTPLKIEWLKEFIKKNEGGHDGELLARLTAAIDTEDPTSSIRAVLYDDAELRDAWFLYRSDRVHDRIEAWLTEHEIDYVDPPPWR